MHMTPFSDIYAKALESWGEDELNARLPEPKAGKTLEVRADSEYLSLMSRRIFRAGLKHSMVDGKWPAFEQVFHHFDIDTVRMMSDEDLENLMADKRIIRHWGKIKSVRANAAAIHELLEGYKGFGQYLSEWPVTNIVGLWEELKQRFTQLGGNSGPYFLRMAGKDTFLLTRDVVRGLNQWGAHAGEPKSKTAKTKVQESFNIWMEESGRSLSHISMTLALSVD